MLQQHPYPNERYTNLGASHYSSLDSCSQLLERTYLRPSKICSLESSPPESKYDAEPERTKKASCAMSDQNHVTEELSANVDEMKHKKITTEPNLRIVECEESSQQQGGDNVEVGKSVATQIADSKSTTVCNPNVDLASMQIDSSPMRECERVNTVVFDNCQLKGTTTKPCDGPSNEEPNMCNDQKLNNDVAVDDVSPAKGSSLRLPGFHQAFGSTEIGRFVRPTDFVEQVPSPTEAPVVFVSTSCRRLKTNSATMTSSMAAVSTTLATVSASHVEVSAVSNHLSKTKGRTRYGKRTKDLAAPPVAAPIALFPHTTHFTTALPSPSSTDNVRNKHWIYGPESDPLATYSPQYNTVEYKRKDLSKSANCDQPPLANVVDNSSSASCYYKGDGGEYSYQNTSTPCYGAGNYVEGDGGGDGGGCGGNGSGVSGSNYGGNSGGGGRFADGYDYDYYRCQLISPYQNCLSSTTDFLTSRSNYASCNSFYCANERAYRNGYLSSSSSSLSPSPSPSSFSTCSSSSSLSSASSSSFSSSSSPSSSSSSPSSLYSSSSSLPSLSPYHSNHNWRSERYFPYNELNGYGASYSRHHQSPAASTNSSPYAYHHQHYIAQNQNTLAQQSFGGAPNYGYNSYPQTVSDYNCY